MHFNWSILGWIAGLVFVYIFGIYEGRGQGYKRRKAEEAQEKKENPPEPARAPEPVTVTVDDPGLMRIKNENGLLTLDLDGTRVNTSALTNDQRKRLIEMLNVIRPWLEGKSAPAPTAVTPPPASQPRPAAPTPPPPTPRPASQPVPSRPATPPAEPRAASAKEDRPSTPSMGIVGQIDSVLQEQLAGTPLDNQGIYLSQSPEGGVIVNVGLNKYMGVDEVPDPEIKAALRAAIAIWENKYTPGL